MSDHETTADKCNDILKGEVAAVRQERDAALATSGGRLRVLLLKGEEARSEWTRAENAIADRDAAVRAARAETLRKCAIAIREGALAGGAHTTTGHVLLGIADKFDSAAREG